MARSQTLLQLRTRARERADMVASQYVTDSELTGYINASYGELYDILVQSGNCYFRNTQTITTDGTTGTIALPADFYGTVGVDYALTTQQWIAVPEIMPHDRNRFQNNGSRGLAYEITGTNLILYPIPPANQTYRHLYIPAPVVLVNDSDAIDGVAGWEELIVVDAAIKCLTKEESDTSVLERERARHLERITAAAQNREWTVTRHIINANLDSSIDEIGLDPARWRY